MTNKCPSRITQQALLGSIERLIKQKPIDAVSVSELTKIAGISRMTFYRHYHNVIDVLTVQTTCLLNKFTSNIKYTGDNYDYIVQTIKFFDCHRKFIKLLLRANQQNLLLSEVTKVMKELAIHNPHLNNFSEREFYYFVEYHTTGLMSVILDWIQNDEPDSIESLANFLDQNMKKDF